MQTETEDSELQEQQITPEVKDQEYHELAKEIIFYSQAELNKLADGPINEDSIQMRAPEDHLTYGQMQWQTCYRYNRSRVGPIIINLERVTKEFDNALRAYFYVVEMPPIKLELPQTRKTPRFGREYDPLKFGELKPMDITITSLTFEQASLLSERPMMGPLATPV